MFQRERPNRCINTHTRRPDLTENIDPEMRMSGKLWRLCYPIYVDCRGIMTTVGGLALDIAIQNKIIVTADEWREANRTQPKGEKELYVDVVSGLPAIYPETGELLAIAGPIAKSKIICGEWVRVNYFMKHYGKTVFMDTRTNEPTQLIGSALFEALAQGFVVGVNMPVRASDIVDRHSEPSLRESTVIPNNFFFTPPIPREKPQFVLTSSIEAITKEPPSVNEAYEMTDEELMDLLTSKPEFLPDASEGPFNLVGEGIDEILRFKKR